MKIRHAASLLSLCVALGAFASPAFAATDQALARQLLDDLIASNTAPSGGPDTRHAVGLLVDASVGDAAQQHQRWIDNLGARFPPQTRILGGGHGCTEAHTQALARWMAQTPQRQYPSHRPTTTIPRLALGFGPRWERWAFVAHPRGKDLRGCAPGASRERWACAAHARGKGADGASAPRGPLASPGSPHGVKRGFHTRRQDPPRSQKRPLPIPSGRDPRGSYRIVSPVRLCTNRLGV